MSFNHKQEAPPEQRPSIYQRFNLKTQDAANAQSQRGRRGSRNQNQPPQGLLYDPDISTRPGAVRVDEMIYGLQMGLLSCSDDSEARLEGLKANTIAALELFLGGSENVKKPLSVLLKDHFDLHLDCWIDESGIRHGRPVDTQGFIASNDDTIVLSYRFSTTRMDWITNMDMTTSEWEPDVDSLLGHAGVCSCADGWLRGWIKGERKPRVHTGFYNNFVHSIPMIRKHILEKLLNKDAKPKKVYLVGYSLGAALAMIAFCYLMLEVSDALMTLDHKIISVTAGCPRVGDDKMKQLVMQKLKRLGALDKAVCCRLVYNQDLVPHIPFHMSGFRHIDKLVYITVDGAVIINPKLNGNKNFKEVLNVVRDFWTAEKLENFRERSTTMIDDNERKKDDQTSFEKEVAAAPGPIKDHMPYWYLLSLEQLKERTQQEHYEV